MLAQSFQSAADLGITEPQKEALMKTLVLLETGKLAHTRGDDERRYTDTPFEDRQFSGEFNMCSWNTPHTCGTVACIGGTAEMVGQLPIYSLDAASETNDALTDLFYPRGTVNYSTTTPAQAATALRSYLTTGDARWDLAVA